MAGRRRRKRRSMGGLFLLLALALLIAGFLTRRMMVPQMLHRLSQRPFAASPAAEQTQSASNAPVSNRNGSGEHLTNKDRKALDSVIRQKTGESH